MMIRSALVVTMMFATSVGLAAPPEDTAQRPWDDVLRDYPLIGEMWVLMSPPISPGFDGKVIHDAGAAVGVLDLSTWAGQEYWAFADASTDLSALNGFTLEAPATSKARWPTRKEYFFVDSNDSTNVVGFRTSWREYGFGALSGNGRKVKQTPGRKCHIDMPLKAVKGDLVQAAGQVVFEVSASDGTPLECLDLPGCSDRTLAFAAFRGDHVNWYVRGSDCDCWVAEEATIKMKAYARCSGSECEALWKWKGTASCK